MKISNNIVETNEIVTLYHGSKSGIKGNIAPISRNRCDFGQGFYMGTDRTQPLTLICNYENAKLYTLKIESEKNRKSGIALADEICKKYRREGRYFDEILKAGE